MDEKDAPADRMARVPEFNPRALEGELAAVGTESARKPFSPQSAWTSPG
jgi:hypothetical protein